MEDNHQALDEVALFCRRLVIGIDYNTTLVTNTAQGCIHRSDGLNLLIDKLQNEMKVMGVCSSPNQVDGTRNSLIGHFVPSYRIKRKPSRFWIVCFTGLTSVSGVYWKVLRRHGKLHRGILSVRR